MNQLRTVGGALSVALVFAAIAAAQVPTGQAPQTGTNTMVKMRVALRIAGESYDFTGPGNCSHAPKASIYNVVAQMWSVSQRDGSRSVSFTLWRPVSGASDMFSLHVSNLGKSHVTNTVTMTRGTARTPTQGSGTAKFEPLGGGGTFTIDATAENGTKITGLLRCESFSMAVAEGGN